MWPGTSSGSVDLEPSIFGIEPNLAVLHQVVTAQLAAVRAGTQSTKTRAEVRGGGAKPFAQKGTGRARQGSSRSPSMSGGGVALGPKPRSYKQHTPKKMVRLALLSALSDRAANDRVALVDEWGWEGPKTKDAVAALTNLEIGGTVLVVLAADETDRRPLLRQPAARDDHLVRRSSPPTTSCATTGSCSPTARCRARDAVRRRRIRHRLRQAEAAAPRRGRRRRRGRGAPRCEACREAAEVEAGRRRGGWPRPTTETEEADADA